MLAASFRLCHRASSVRINFADFRVRSIVPSNCFCTKPRNDEEFKPIYKLPFISIGAAVNKIKMIQLVLAGIAVPGSVLANLAEVCNLETTITVSTVGVASTIAVCLMGQVFSNMIGFVYVSPDLQTVRFSYLDFWGRRQNIDFPREELIPLSNSAKYLTDIFYTKVYRYSATSPNKINLKFGEIMNTEAFEYIFKHSPD